MNAESHFQEAERLLAVPAGGWRPKESDVARAQVHAILALAAVTAEAAGMSVTSESELAALDR